MILCLDYGSRYVGIAITDPDERLALRYSTVDQKQTDAIAAIRKILEQEKIKQIIVGVPVNLAGKQTQQSRVSLNFIEQLRQSFPDRTVQAVDETLTSVEAERRLKIEGANPAESHSESARLMLEGYLRLSR